MLYSTVMFPRRVSTTTRIYASVHTHKKRLSVHFLTYEVMPMRNFKHITPCSSHNFPQVQSKQSTTSRLFNIPTLLTMQLLTSCSRHTAWTRRSSPNIGNYGTSCIQIRPLMRKFACGHVHVSQKVAQRDVFFTVNTHRSPSRGSN